MSYCRWSCDDFQCDIYAYEAKDGYQIHIASRKVVYKEPLPEMVPVVPDTEKYLERYAVVRDIRARSEYVRIDLPHAGESHGFADINDFYDTMVYLRDLGYRFPDYVLDMIKEEIESGC